MQNMRCSFWKMALHSSLYYQDLLDYANRETMKRNMEDKILVVDNTPFFESQALKYKSSVLIHTFWLYDLSHFPLYRIITISTHFKDFHGD